tara:strand:- start:3307 stop:3795 length:489 start_codon:yes stop_codon:yes gene_type:complete
MTVSIIKNEVSEKNTKLLGFHLGKDIVEIEKNNLSVIFVSGELGVGKTTFIKGIMGGLGYENKVKSPTFSLVEIYETDFIKIFHFDLYRIKSSKELLEIGLYEYLEEESICIFEWPENGREILPKPNLDIKIEHKFEGIDKRKLSFNSEIILKNLEVFSNTI